MKARLKFLANLDEPLVYIPSKGGDDETEHVGNFATQEVTVHDGRQDKHSSSLDVEGFKLVRHSTAVEDFYDEAQIESPYHDEVKALLTEMTGAARVEIFDDTRRSASIERRKQKEIREPADIVHNDYTARPASPLRRSRLASETKNAVCTGPGRWRSRGIAVSTKWRTASESTTTKRRCRPLEVEWTIRFRSTATDPQTNNWGLANSTCYSCKEMTLQR